MRADRQTDRQLYRHCNRNTYGGRVLVKEEEAKGLHVCVYLFEDDQLRCGKNESHDPREDDHSPAACL